MKKKSAEIRNLIENKPFLESVDLLIENGYAVSKAQARRITFQIDKFIDPPEEGVENGK